VKRAVWIDGWWRHARHVRSPNVGPRPAGTEVTLVVVHSISLPPGQYGGDAVERFFTNRLDASQHPYFEQIAALRVSAHFFIRRDGAVLQFASCDDRAWHAGASQWRGREGCNDWSIGVELEGLEGERFARPQYRALLRVLRAAAARWPLADVVGHEHVAPGRKADPGARFEWRRVARDLRGLSVGAQTT
jgi:N-acetyl-anhydromuramoyl-L-alanine amidase